MATAVMQRINQVPCSIDKVMEYQHPGLVQRFQDKLGISQAEAVQLFEDTKRFLYLCAASKDPIAPSESLDAGWHEFLLYTEDYADFCGTFLGRFIHHRPRRPDEPSDGYKKGRRALDLAHEVFGEDLSSNWEYPKIGVTASSPCDDCGCNSSCTDGE